MAGYAEWGVARSSCLEPASLPQDGARQQILEVAAAVEGLPPGAHRYLRGAARFPEALPGQAALQAFPPGIIDSSLWYYGKNGKTRERNNTRRRAWGTAASPKTLAQSMRPPSGICQQPT